MSVVRKVQTGFDHMFLCPSENAVSGKYTWYVVFNSRSAGSAMLTTSENQSCCTILILRPELGVRSRSGSGLI